MDEQRLAFDLRSYTRLSRGELYAILRLRHRVFVLDQEITAAPDIDGRDPEADHAVVTEGDELVATARVRWPGERAKVERVAVAPERRGDGIGTHLMRRLQERFEPGAAAMHAQAHLRPWYERLGWEVVGDPFVEAEIEHVEMVWRPAG